MAPLDVESVDLVLHLSVRAVQLVFARGALRFSLRTQIALVVVVSARVELLLLAHRFKVIGLMRGQPPVAQPVARVQRLCLVRLAAVLPRSQPFLLFVLRLIRILLRCRLRRKDSGWQALICVRGHTKLSAKGLRCRAQSILCLGGQGLVFVIHAAFYTSFVLASVI